MLTFTDPVATAEVRLASVETKITAEQQTLATAEAGATRLASLAVESGSPNDEQKYKAAAATLASARERLGMLVAAHRSGVEALRTAKFDAAMAARDSYRKVAQKLTTKRQKGAAKIAEAIVLLNAGWREMHDANTSLTLSYPGTLPDGLLTKAAAVERAVAGELHRIGNVIPSLGGTGMGRVPAMPGAKAPTVSTMHNPTAVEPIVKQVEEANAYIVRSLDSNFVPPPPAAVEPEAEPKGFVSKLFEALSPSEPAPSPVKAPTLTAAEVAATMKRPPRTVLRNGSEVTE